MNILKSYPETINKATLYAMTSGTQSEKVSNYVDEEIVVRAYVLYQTTDRESGELKKVLSILNDENRILSTISTTFVEEFERIAEIWGSDTIPPLQVVSKTSKKGRAYITCGIKIEAV